jgi:hypothetical protein
MRHSLLVFAAALAGCSGGDDTEPVDPPEVAKCELAFLGDPNAPIEMQLLVAGTDLIGKPAADGDPLPLCLPPQGGRVAFAGVVATNVDPCGVKLSGAVRDGANNQVRLDIRTVNLRVDGVWGRSADGDMSTFANIPLCPNNWASTDAYGNSFALTVSVTDAGGRQASSTVSVVPTCATCAEPDNEAECLCMCGGDYTLGQECG